MNYYQYQPSYNQLTLSTSKNHSKSQSYSNIKQTQNASNDSPLLNNSSFILQKWGYSESLQQISQSPKKKLQEISQFSYSKPESLQLHQEQLSHRKQRQSYDILDEIMQTNSQKRQKTDTFLSSNESFEDFQQGITQRSPKSYPQLQVIEKEKKRVSFNTQVQIQDPDGIIYNKILLQPSKFKDRDRTFQNTKRKYQIL